MGSRSAACKPDGVMSSRWLCVVALVGLVGLVSGYADGPGPCDAGNLYDTTFPTGTFFSWSSSSGASGRIVPRFGRRHGCARGNVRERSWRNSAPRRFRQRQRGLCTVSQRDDRPSQPDGWRAVRQHVHYVPRLQGPRMLLAAQLGHPRTCQSGGSVMDVV